nr:MAG TPA: asparaginyl-tRNA synthetase [Caudoviricetes sp.]
MDSIEVSDQLTIGGAPPLGQDAIDKLQEQIINPSQSIVVDNINGSDETGDGTTSKPYKTINKAVSAIKPNVPDIKIYLNASTDNRIYDVTPIRVKNDKISFLTYDRDDNYVNKNDVAKPIIRLNYGSIRSNWSVDGDLYWWGNMFIYCKEIDITRVRIQLFDPYTEENSARMIFICEKFTGYSMSIEAQSYAVFGMYNTDNSIILGKNNSSIKITGNNYLVVTREKFYSCLKDPKTGDPGTRWILGGSGVFTVVYSIMKDSTTTIDSNILSKNNYGCNNSVHVGFANYSN